jgi:hypothetical protein
LGTFKHRFNDFVKVVIYDVQKADYVFTGPLAFVKYHLSNFVQDAFFNKHNAENDFALPFDIMKHRFIDITNVVF